MALLEEAKQKWPIDKLCKRPWKAEALMILDADGQTVMHLGGMNWGKSTADPFFLTALADFIVESVNRRAVRAELQKAAEIADKYKEPLIAEEIRKLMD